jgi:hypothetical protein
MWQEYGKKGVAICSRYSLLKSALSDFSDQAYIGLVRYGARHLVRRQLEGHGWNLFRLITTKRVEFAQEREVRAFLWLPQYLGDDRHIDDQNRVYPYPLTPPPPHVPNGLRRKVNLQALLTKVVVSPWASPTTINEITRLVTDNALDIAIELRTNATSPTASVKRNSRESALSAVIQAGRQKVVWPNHRHPAEMTASEVKSHSSLDRFLVAFHSPTEMAEPDCSLRSEKMAECRDVTQLPKTFSVPV